MTKLFLQLITLFPYFLGFGLLSRVAIKKLANVELPNSPGLLLILGIYVVGFFTLTWNLFLPAGNIFTYLLFSMGILGLFIFRKDFRGQKSELAWVIGLFLVLAFLGMRIDISSDSSGYHLPGIIWTKSEPLPIGIVNLNNALPFNSLLYSVNAAAKLPFLDFSAPFLVNAWLCAGFFSFCFSCLGSKAKNEKMSRIFSALILMSFIPLSVYLRHNLGSPSMEISTTLLTILPIFFIFKSFETKNTGDGEIIIAFLFGILAVMVRLSAAPILALPFLFYFFKKSNHSEPLRSSFFIKTFTLGAFFLIPWLTRGILSSGCLAYPAHYTCLKFLPWEGSAIAQDVSTSSAAWVRSPGVSSEIVLRDWAWLKTWLPLTWSFGVVKLAATSIGASVVAFAINRKNFQKKLTIFFLFFFSFSFLFWFFALPDARYGYGFFLAVGPVFLALAMGNWGLEKYIRWVPALVFFALFYKSVVHMRSNEAPESYENWPPFAKVEYAPMQLMPDNIQIYVPTTQNQNCWDKIPCTRRVMPGLQATRTAGGRLIFTIENNQNK